MNANTVLVGGVVVLLALGGLIFFTSQNMAPSSTATSTPTTIPGPTPQPSQAGVPVATTNSSVAPSDTTAVVSGKVTPKGALTMYWYEYGTTPNLGSKTSNQGVGSGYASVPAPDYITGLTKDTTYYFRLVAENQYGRTAGTAYTFRTTVGNPPPAGSAPTTKTLAASSVTRTAATLRGEVTPNKASTQYWFEYGKTANLGATTALVSVGDGSAKVTTSASIDNLDPATTYYFRMNAQNQFGTVNGAILTFKTAGPAVAAPSVSTLSAAFVATSSATLRATVDPNGAQTTYWFEYSTDSLFSATLLKTTPKKSAGSGTSALSESADISGLKPKTTYYFRIVAENSQDIVRGSRVTFKTK
ncbi:MAG: hypothetical protein Q7S50_02750 [bacterium]|nr:hypothetical protein [bacterium]